jgi:hypothetical protein
VPARRASPAKLPRSAAQLDCALIMRKVPVNWQALPPLPATKARPA